MQPTAARRRVERSPPLAELRGLGPSSASALAAIGIRSVAALRESDPFEIYAQLKRRFPRTSTNMLYALIGAIENRDWREVARKERTSILLRLEAMELLR